MARRIGAILVLIFFILLTSGCTPLFQYKSYPAISANASKIAYLVSHDIYVMDASGQSFIKLTESSSDIFNRSQAWSPQGTKIAFERGIYHKSLVINDIYTVNADGSLKVNLTNSPEVDDHSPAWSSDGAKIVYSSGPVSYYDIYAMDTPSDIYAMNADGSNKVNLTNSPEVDDYSPAWSPDGTKIVYSSRATPSNRKYYSSDIYAMNSDGSGKVNLTNSPGIDDYSPAWSPDGTRIAYISFHKSSDDIYVMNADGSNKVNLTNSPEVDDYSPAWSPDGTKIAYSSHTRSPSGGPTVVFKAHFYSLSDIYLTSADGSNKVNLTNSPEANDDSPAWSPDGAKIFYSSKTSSFRYYRSEIYTMNTDGSNNTVIGGDYRAFIYSVFGLIALFVILGAGLLAIRKAQIITGVVILLASLSLIVPPTIIKGFWMMLRQLVGVGLWVMMAVLIGSIIIYIGRTRFWKNRSMSNRAFLATCAFFAVMDTIILISLSESSFDPSPLLVGTAILWLVSLIMAIALLIVRKKQLAKGLFAGCGLAAVPLLFVSFVLALSLGG